MKRAGRIVYLMMGGLSLLLLLATVVVWVRSYWVSDTLSWYDRPEDRSFLDMKHIRCSRGGLQFEAHRELAANIHAGSDRHFQHDRSATTKYPAFGDDWNHAFFPKPRRYAALGFEWNPESAGQWGEFPPKDYVFKSLTLPLYFPTLLFAILPAHYLLRVRRRRRMARRTARGCCIACGYDLRASSGRCPECGLPVSTV